MAGAQPFIGSIQTVENQWIDYNGHLNMAYYLVLFDRCADEVFALVGLGAEYVRDANASFFTLEAHITYLRELHAGDRVKVTAQFLDYDAKRVHYVQQLSHADEGWLSAVTENMVIHVDMSAKRSAPFPTAVLDKIRQIHAEHRRLPIPPQVGHVIGISKK